MKEILFKWLILLPTLAILHLLLQKIKPISVEKRRKIWLSLTGLVIFDLVMTLFSTNFPRTSRWLWWNLIVLLLYGLMRLCLPMLLLERRKETRLKRIGTCLIVLIWLGLT